MRDNVLRYIRDRGLMRAGDRVLAAVSGGADSVALLRLLIELRPELGVVLAVAHFNHGLRGEQSAADVAFVADLAKQHGLEFFTGHADVREYAAAAKLTVEAAGRRLRYEWFARVASEQRFDCVATAHTRDDQAETVLLKFLRGAGTRGLAGIYPMMVRDGARIVRPLLCLTRAEVETYLSSIGQVWREDESNLDRRFLRNRVRHDLLPLLEREYNPNLRQLLSELADVSRAEEDYWAKLVDEYLKTKATPGQHLKTKATPGQLNLEGFGALPLALQRRILKRFAERDGPALDFEHVERLRRCAVGELRRAELPGGRIAVNTKSCLQLCTPERKDAHAYEYVLPVPGEIHIPELNQHLRAALVPEEFARESPPGVLLNRDLLGPQLIVRNWRHGDRYQPAHRRSPEKLKKRFANQQIPAAQRATWPVAMHGDNIVWVEGLPIAAAYEWKSTGDAVKIEIIPHRSHP